MYTYLSSILIESDVSYFRNPVVAPRGDLLRPRKRRLWGVYRWNAAQCLQEQIDATRGVEYTKRLAKSRAIKDRFGRRAIMRDLQG